MRPRSFKGGAKAGRPPVVGPVDAGLRLLGRRAHSQQELRRKLARRGYSEADVATALSRLAELGYLDDRSFAEGHVRRRSTALGPRALSAELAARGVGREEAEQALAGFGPEAQLGAATRLAERLYGARSWPGYREMLNWVGPRLLRRGYAPGIVQAACRALWSGTSTESDA